MKYQIVNKQGRFYCVSRKGVFAMGSKSQGTAFTVEQLDTALRHARELFPHHTWRSRPAID